MTSLQHCRIKHTHTHTHTHINRRYSHAHIHNLSVLAAIMQLLLQSTEWVPSFPFFPNTHCRFMSLHTHARISPSSLNHTTQRTQEQRNGVVHSYSVRVHSQSHFLLSRFPPLTHTHREREREITLVPVACPPCLFTEGPSLFTHWGDSRVLSSSFVCVLCTMNGDDGGGGGGWRRSMYVCR